MKISCSQKSHLSDSLCLLVILLVGIFYIKTLCPGHGWGDDFSVYINGAKNIAAGKDYVLTGYIFNPHNNIGPGSLPPVTSLCLAPAYALFGMNIFAFQIEGIFFFVLSLFIIWRLFRDKLPYFYTPAVLVFIGFSPLFWSFKNSVLSEYYFILFLYLFFLVVDRYHNKYGGLDSWGWALVLGFLLCLVYNTRTIGVLAFIAFILHEIFVRKSASFFLKVASVFIIVELVQRSIFHFDVFGYLSIPNNYSISPGKNLGLNYKYLQYFLTAGNLKYFKQGMLLFALGVFGYVARVRDLKRVSICEIFLILYFFSFTCLYTIPRYLLPLLPLMTFYIFYGIRSLPRYSLFVFTVCVAVILFRYAFFYGHNIDFKCGPPYGFCSEEAQDLFSFIRNNTSLGDTIIFHKPRALYLATGRRSAAAPPIVDDYLGFCGRLGAKYVVFENNDVGCRYVAALKQRSSLLFRNRNFTVYKILAGDIHAK